MATQKKIERYGRIPDLPDIRDLKFSVVTPTPVLDFADCTGKMPPIVNQGDLGSCTANAVAAAYYATLTPGQKLVIVAVSRLFVYYWERYIENTVNFDSGASVKDSVAAVHTYGAPPETSWPYDIRRFKVKPSGPVIKEALNHQATLYMSVAQTANELRHALMTNFPVLMGFTVYESFESDQVARTGIVPMPTRNEKVLGGHAVVIVGYDQRRPANQTWKLRNSWGTTWGDHGYFYVSDEFMFSELCSDFRTIRASEG